MSRFLSRLMALNDGWAKPFGDFNHRWVSALFRPIRPIRDFLNGTWLGHPLHPAATDIPIGALLVAVVLDFIGPPGSGKTTALVNSGLRFPMEQEVGRRAIKGVGGTRNCDWWFTDEAVFLDTAGRFTTQDSDANADSAGWAEFLKLLQKYRKRRPVNGVILTISAQDLMAQGHSSREAHVAAARRRLTELNKELNVKLPVYLMVTKCDLVAGFTEYFDDVAQEGRAQVWGVTFPYELTASGGAAAAFPNEFDALMSRLNERDMRMLSTDRNIPDILRITARQKLVIGK